ncbi:MAG: class I SAM-dependent methyltransferase [Kiloniellales bacterium]|nr:class I SAM-dependent methyltransferase [Kiloniellales bacterium]
MSYRPTPLTEDLHRYLLEFSLREPDLLTRLREETARRGDAGMQISPEQGQFMALLIELTGAKRVLEIGTFTGYSALSMALALPPDGRIIACDVEPETTAVAQRYWAEAGVAEKIDLRLAPALDTLDGLLVAGAAESFDFAFIDADKENYVAYYERCLALLRQGGLLAIDNVLWNGAVANPAARDPDTEAIRALNLRLREDPRISLSMVPISDGLSLARKR